ncbi:hypothetical protein ACWDBF_07955 [Streptomyces angustmyceticus]
MKEERLATDHPTVDDILPTPHHPSAAVTAPAAPAPARSSLLTTSTDLTEEIHHLHGLAADFKALNHEVLALAVTPGVEGRR